MSSSPRCRAPLASETSKTRLACPHRRALSVPEARSALTRFPPPRARDTPAAGTGLGVSGSGAAPSPDPLLYLQAGDVCCSNQKSICGPRSEGL